MPKTDDNKLKSMLARLTQDGQSLVRSLISLVSLSLLVSCFDGEDLPQAHQLEGIPDTLQTAAMGAVHGDGSQYCAPAAAANSLSWLSGRPDDAIEIMIDLAGSDFMNTSLENGTGPDKFLYGVHRFATNEMQRNFDLHYRGWRPLPAGYGQFSDGRDIEPKWIGSAIAKGNAVWFNIGWYRNTGEIDHLQRDGGHWITVTGYDFTDGSFKFTVHDSAPRAGSQPRNHVITLTPLNSSWLNGPNKGLPRSANGLFQIAGGLTKKSSADSAIVDGVVILEL